MVKSFWVTFIDIWRFFLVTLVVKQILLHFVFLRAPSRNEKGHFH